jgi:hypothetical protein
MQRFAILYGANKVKAMYLEDDNAVMAANEAWEMFLQSANPDHIKKVLASLPGLDREWPPSLAEFSRMVKDFNRVEGRTDIALPAPKVQTDIGRKALADMKAMLRVSPNTQS